VSDLIDRREAIDAIEITPFDDYGDYMRARELIEALPSAQPEIIRCKDCKYYLLGNDDQFYCFKHDDDILWQDDSFCSFAERKEK
jgi:hypothetical protein